MLPRRLFFMIAKRLRGAILGSDKDPTWDALEDTLDDLCRQMDCVPMWDGEDHRRSQWSKHEKPFVGWVLSDDPSAMPERSLLNFRVDRTGFIHPLPNGLRNE